VVTEHSDEPRLPVPPPAALEHSRALTGRIRREIAAAGGAIRFSRYHELALYAPGLGYYSAGATRFGEAGDFVTAPEISPLFSRCLARACARVLADLEGGVIVELGAGSGRMAADMLTELAALGQSPARYLILEVSADLRQRQAATLERLAPRQAAAVRWLDAIPTGIEGVIIGNEVLDALPVERFTIEADGVRYLGVGQDADGPCWRALPADEPLEQWLAALQRMSGAPLPIGYTSEFCPGLNDWTAAIAAGLDRGALVLIDYGLPRGELYRPERIAGTLRCHYRHRAHDDPFVYPGLQDITAWVDFTTVAEAATGAGLTLDGFTTQAGFLVGCGLLTMLDPRGAVSRESVMQSNQAGQLILPGQMGERCRVIAFSRDWAGTLPGLTAPDLSGSL
jgi:SAM-dependent MidA family methyltransferase